MGVEQLPQLRVGRTRQGEAQRLAARRIKDRPSSVDDAQPEVPRVPTLAKSARMGHPRFVVAHTKPLLLAGKGAPPADS
jgi:hypothetical protein